MRRKDRQPKQHNIQKRVRRLEERIASLEEQLSAVHEELAAEVSIRAFREKDEKETITTVQNCFPSGRAARPLGVTDKEFVEYLKKQKLVGGMF